MNLSGFGAAQPPQIYVQCQNGWYQMGNRGSLAEYEYQEEEGGRVYSLYHVTVSPRFAHLSTEEVRLQAYSVPEPMQVDPPSWGLQYSVRQQPW